MLMILRGGGILLLGPIIGALPDTVASDVARDHVKRKSVEESWPVLRMATTLPTGSRAIPRPRLIRPGLNPRAPTAEVSPHG